jgi:hypothetical protein
MIGKKLDIASMLKRLNIESQNVRAAGDVSREK